MGKTVLIVEDEKTIVDILKFNLMREGYETLEALDGLTGLELGRTKDPDLILLDVMLPGMNGFDVCAALRDGGSTVPILMLTAREEESDKVFGLEAGADDYITKPFSMRELLARVKANIRRRSQYAGTRGPGENLLKLGELSLDLNSVSLQKAGRIIEVSQKEFDLLACFAKEPGRVFSREELMERVWNYDYFGDVRTVDVTIRRLREKVEDDPGSPRYIRTKRGAGYYGGE